MTHQNSRDNLESIAANFEAIANHTLTTTYFRYDILENSYKLRLPTLVVGHIARFAD